MTKPRKTVLRLAIAGMISAGLLFPVTLASGSDGLPTLAPNDVCASASCCFELGSVCQDDGDTRTHYRDGRTCSDS